MEQKKEPNNEQKRISMNEYDFVLLKFMSKEYREISDVYLLDISLNAA